MELLTASFLAILHSPDTYGHIFYINILLGTFLVAKKNKLGWLTRVIGDIGWVILGWFIGMYSIVIWSSIFALNDFRGYLIWKWSEDENRKHEEKQFASSRETKMPEMQRNLDKIKRRQIKHLPELQNEMPKMQRRTRKRDKRVTRKPKT